jgi:hypothetical protein
MTGAPPVPAFAAPVFDKNMFTEAMVDTGSAKLRAAADTASPKLETGRGDGEYLFNLPVRAAGTYEFSYPLENGVFVKFTVMVTSAAASGQPGAAQVKYEVFANDADGTPKTPTDSYEVWTIDRGVKGDKNDWDYYPYYRKGASADANWHAQGADHGLKTVNSNGQPLGAPIAPTHQDAAYLTSYNAYLDKYSKTSADNPAPPAPGTTPPPVLGDDPGNDPDFNTAWNRWAALSSGFQEQLTYDWQIQHNIYKVDQNTGAVQGTGLGRWYITPPNNPLDDTSAAIASGAPGAANSVPLFRISTDNGYNGFSFTYKADGQAAGRAVSFLWDGSVLKFQTDGIKKGRLYPLTLKFAEEHSDINAAAPNWTRAGGLRLVTGVDPAATTVEARANGINTDDQDIDKKTDHTYLNNYTLYINDTEIPSILGGESESQSLIPSVVTTGSDGKPIYVTPGSEKTWVRVSFNVPLEWTGGAFATPTSTSGYDLTTQISLNDPEAANTNSPYIKMNKTVNAPTARAPIPVGAGGALGQRNEWGTDDDPSSDPMIKGDASGKITLDIYDLPPSKFYNAASIAILGIAPNTDGTEVNDKYADYNFAPSPISASLPIYTLIRFNSAVSGNYIWFQPYRKVTGTYQLWTPELEGRPAAEKRVDKAPTLEDGPNELQFPIYGDGVHSAEYWIVFVPDNVGAAPISQHLIIIPPKDTRVGIPTTFSAELISQKPKTRTDFEHADVVVKLKWDIGSASALKDYFKTESELVVKYSFLRDKDPQGGDSREFFGVTATVTEDPSLPSGQGQYIVKFTEPSGAALYGKYLDHEQVGNPASFGLSIDKDLVNAELQVAFPASHINLTDAEAFKYPYVYFMKVKVSELGGQKAEEDGLTSPYSSITLNDLAPTEIITPSGLTVLGPTVVKRAEIEDANNPKQPEVSFGIKWTVQGSNLKQFLDTMYGEAPYRVGDNPVTAFADLYVTQKEDALTKIYEENFQDNKNDFAKRTHTAKDELTGENVTLPDGYSVARYRVEYTDKTGTGTDLNPGKDGVQKTDVKFSDGYTAELPDGTTEDVPAHGLNDIRPNAALYASLDDKPFQDAFVTSSGQIKVDQIEEARKALREGKVVAITDIPINTAVGADGKIPDQAFSYTFDGLDVNQNYYVRADVIIQNQDTADVAEIPGTPAQTGQRIPVIPAKPARSGQAIKVSNPNTYQPVNPADPTTYIVLGDDTDPIDPANLPAGSINSGGTKYRIPVKVDPASPDPDNPDYLPVDPADPTTYVEIDASEPVNGTHKTFLTIPNPGDTPGVPGTPGTLASKAMEFASKLSATVSVVMPDDPKVPTGEDKVPPAPTLEITDKTNNTADMQWKAIADDTEGATIEYELIRLKDTQMPDELLNSNKSDFNKVWAALSSNGDKLGLRTYVIAGEDDELLSYDGSYSPPDTASFGAKADGNKLTYNLDADPLKIKDMTLYPNQVYFYYIRTAKRTPDGPELYSVWNRATLTTNPVKAPRNLKLAKTPEDRKAAFDPKTQVYVEFEAPVTDDEQLDSLYELQYQLKIDDGQWGDPVAMTKADLLLVKPGDATADGYRKYTYLLKGLSASKQYEMRVRLKDKNTGDFSQWTNSIKFRTEFNQKDYDKEKEIDDALKRIEELLNDLLKKPYWESEVNDGVLELEYKTDYFMDSLDKAGTLVPLYNNGAAQGTYYIPQKVLTQLNDRNKGLLIKNGDTSAAVSPLAITTYNEAVAAAAKDIKAGRAADYYLRLRTDFVKTSAQIDGNDPMSPQVTVFLELVAAVEPSNTIDAQLTADYKAIIEKILKDENLRKAIDQRVTAKIQDEDLVKFMEGTVENTRRTFQSIARRRFSVSSPERRIRQTYTIDEIEKPIIITQDNTQELATVKGYENTGGWREIPISLTPPKISATRQGTFIFAGKIVNIPGVQDMAHGGNISGIVGKYGLGDLLGDGSNVNMDSALTRGMAIASVARMAGAAKADDPVKWIKENMGASVSSRSPSGGIRNDELIYLSMLLYEKKTGTKASSVKIKDFSRDFTGVSASYKPYVAAAAELGLTGDITDFAGTAGIGGLLKLLGDVDSKAKL